MRSILAVLAPLFFRTRTQFSGHAADDLLLEWVQAILAPELIPVADWTSSRIDCIAISTLLNLLRPHALAIEDCGTLTRRSRTQSFCGLHRTFNPTLRSLR
jgi:hypothetical protein